MLTTTQIEARKGKLTASRVACLATIAEAIRITLNPSAPDISAVMSDISALLDNSITGVKVRDAGPPALDLSKINFEALASRFQRAKHKNTEIESTITNTFSLLNKFKRPIKPPFLPAS